MSGFVSLKQYDTDDSESWSLVELLTMLDSLGSTMTRATIESFFTRFNKTPEQSLSIDEALICLEDQLTKPRSEKREVDKVSAAEATDGGHDATSSHSGAGTPSPELSLADNATGSGMSFTGLPLTGEPANGVPAKDQPASGIDTFDATSAQHLQQDASSSSLRLPGMTPSRQSSVLTESGAESGVEHQELEKIINIRTCPLCHKQLHKKAEVDMVSHLAVCASQDWSSLNSLTVANFVSTSQAQRKWFSKFVNKVSNGAYKLGADSANILVQNRMTGQLQEEKMQVYVRVGIRLWYRAAGSSSRMEANRIKKLLRNMTTKQGAKFNAPESVAEIERFIAFHGLDINEILEPLDSFKHFNAFFYRKLKPDARPCEDPDDPMTLVSSADCRFTCFQTIHEATQLWIKGRTFTIKKLLGDMYKDEAARYEGGSVCIFRLAPQDYHRYHSGVDGKIGKMSAISGEYYTVNPIAIRSGLDVYAENARVIVPMDSPAFGRVMNVCIGAMMVGSIDFTKKEGDEVKRAEEYGMDLVNNSRACIETLVRVGMRIGKRA
ncbi:phosphatidylserine decarboxylase [Cystobasidiomycetes sp. EMM_F5]